MTRGAGKRGRGKRGSTLRELLAQASTYLQAAHIAEAEAVCRRILDVLPDQPHALYMLAMCGYQARRDPTAVPLLQRVLEIEPRLAEAWNSLGIIYREHGKLDAALDAHRRALEVQPELVAAHLGLGSTLVMRGETAAGINTFNTAVELAPDSVPVATEFAAALRRAGRATDAVLVARAAVERMPESSEAHGLLAIELHEQGRLDDAAECHRRAVSLAPESAVAHTNLGVTLHALDDLDGALQCHRQAIALAPRNGRAQYNCGLALLQLNRLDEGIECLRAVVGAEPGNADARWDLALALLGAGRLREGWEEFEWRWRASAFPSSERHTDLPRWDGSALTSRRLLLWAEQGLGDTIQFARYANLLARPGTRLVIECAPQLQRLLGSLRGVESIVTRDQSPGEIDVQVPLLSLPRLFGTTLRSIPAQVPYLAPLDEDVERWRRELGSDGPRIGLVWAGSPTHGNDRNRSIAPQLLAPLLALPGVTYFSLQVGEKQQLEGPVVDLAPRLVDFAETAAVIANLDLVITVDTAVAHLAGAIGAPVWVLLPYAADWRWLQDRDDSPWYPTMHLFRQQRRGDWQPVIERVAAQLADRIQCMARSR